MDLSKAGGGKGHAVEMGEHLLGRLPEFSVKYLVQQGAVD